MKDDSAIILLNQFIKFFRLRIVSCILIMNKCPYEAIIAAGIPSVVLRFLLPLTLHLALLLLGSVALRSIPQVRLYLPSVQDLRGLRFCNRKPLSRA